MTQVLSLLSRPGAEARESAAFLSHADYCASHGYAHRVDDMSHLPTRALREMHTLHAACRALRELAPGEVLMAITDESVVYRPMPLEQLMDGRDALMTFEKQRAGQPEIAPQMNWIVLRNTPDVRRRLQATIFDVHKKVIHDEGRKYEAMYGRLGGVPYYSQLGGRHLNINWKTEPAGWFNAQIFVINALPGAVLGIDKQEFDAGLDDRRLDDIVLQQARAGSRGEPHMVTPPPGGDEPPYEVLNAHAPIAFVTLRTPEIAGYGRIGEANLRRYCQRHGIALHAYRRIPDGLDPKVNGTWHKPDLVLRHLDAHEWVVWVDADVVITDPSFDIRQLLAGRDVLLAKDLGGYEFNAGVLGFRRAPAVRAALEHVRTRIAAIADKSSVYVSGGDQEQFIWGFYDTGMLRDHEVLDCLSFNTPPALWGPSTFMVHYVGIREPYRSLYMAHDDALSRQR